MKQLFERLILGTEKYIKENCLKSMVLGISGGIDSTICAAIGYEINKRNPEITLIGASLPCSTNKEDELLSARYVGEAFCNKFIEQDLQPTFQTVLEACEIGDSRTTLISQGNIKARLRMIYLYNLSSINSGLVLDTDNLTENFLGFFTIHGDQGDFKPIGGLWKHEIYELSKWLVEEYYPKSSLQAIAILESSRLIPTDGNGVAEGGDMAQIAPGLTYLDVDKIIDSFMPLGKEDEISIREKYSEEVIDQVWKRYKRSEYKRNPIPTALEICGDL